MTALIKSADAQNLSLTGRGGVKLGVVRELFVDMDSGQIKFLAVEIAALLGGGGKFHPVPWSHTSFDAAANLFQARLSKDELKASPSYDREQLSKSGYGWDQQSAMYFDGLPNES